MRFGIGMNTDHTLEEVGQQFSVTRERIRQIEAKALRKLKHPSRSRGRCGASWTSNQVAERVPLGTLNPGTQGSSSAAPIAAHLPSLLTSDTFRQTARGPAVDRFSFFFAFYGLILGLGVAELLSGFAGMVRAHALKKLEAQTALAALLTFVLIVATWVDTFTMERSITLNFGDLWAPILLATFYYLAAAVIFPRDPGQYSQLQVFRRAPEVRDRDAVRGGAGRLLCKQQLAPQVQHIVRDSSGDGSFPTTSRSRAASSHCSWCAAADPRSSTYLPNPDLHGALLAGRRDRPHVDAAVRLLNGEGRARLPRLSAI